MHPFSAMTIPAILIILLALFLNYFLPQIDNVFLDIIYRSTIISILYISIAYYGNISKEFNNQLNKITFNKLPWKKLIQWSDFEKIDIRVGTVIRSEINENTLKPSFIIHVNFGPLGIKKTSAQITTI